MIDGNEKRHQLSTSKAKRAAEARKLTAAALAAKARPPADDKQLKRPEKYCEPAVPPGHGAPLARPCRVVERTWIYDCGGDLKNCKPPPSCGDHKRDDICDGNAGGGGSDGGSKGGGRPTRPHGSDTGRGGNGDGLTPGDIKNPNEPGVFVGPRADLQLPYLFMRANPADLGARPIVDAPFWESPDIFVLAGIDPNSAPDIPTTLGDIAHAGAPNTLYAHVWNFGNAAAGEVLVEFYWVNPSLGINANSVTLIAQTFTSIGAKGSGNAHVMVKCPEPWVPSFVNGGHECLLVRVWDNPSDLPGQPAFDASWNRHVAQRNIHVDPPPGGPMGASRATADGPAMAQPILIKVGPLFGAPATVKVDRVSPSAVPWLQLRTGVRGLFPPMASPTGAPALSAGAGPGGGFPPIGGDASQLVHGDDQHVAFTTSDKAPAEGEAHVYRISASQNGEVFGGYTVVVLG